MQSQTHTGFAGKARESLARILDHVLAEECFLLEKTRDYRWNVMGPNLYSLHRLFDEQRRQLDYWLGRVRERTKSIGLGRCEMEKQKARLAATDARSVAPLPARTIIGDLLSRHERIAQRLRDDIERLRDPVTADLLRGLLEFHETTAWILRVANDGADATPADSPSAG